MMCIENSFLSTHIRNVFILSTFLIMSGCSTFSAPKEVNIPVLIPCISESPVKPDYTFEMSKGKSEAEQVRALVVDRELSLAYEALLESILIACK